MLVEFRHFLEVLAIDYADYGVVLLGFCDEGSFASVDELRLAKAFALFECVYLLVLKLYLIAEVGHRYRLMRFLKNRQA